MRVYEMYAGHANKHVQAKAVLSIVEDLYSVSVSYSVVNCDPKG